MAEVFKGQPEWIRKLDVYLEREEKLQLKFIQMVEMKDMSKMKEMAEKYLLFLNDLKQDVSFFAVAGTITNVLKRVQEVNNVLRLIERCGHI